MAKTVADQKKITTALNFSPEISLRKCLIRDTYEKYEKERLLNKLHSMLRTVYQGVEMPCRDVVEIVNSIRMVHDMMNSYPSLNYQLWCMPDDY